MATITRKSALFIAMTAMERVNFDGNFEEISKGADYNEVMEVLDKMLVQLCQPRKATKSKARVINEGLAKKVYDLAGDVTTSKDVVNMGLPEISTTQKAIAVLRVGCELGLFVKGDGKTVAYAKVYGN